VHSSFDTPPFNQSLNNILKRKYIRLSPLNMKIIAPSERNGPKGMAYLVSLPFANISGIPTIVPNTEPETRLKITP
jgi:hypothetical protein